MFGTSALKQNASKLPPRALLAASLACFGFVFNGNAEDLVPLHIKMPAPIFMDWLGKLPSPDVERPSGKPRPQLMVPPGVSNVALGKTVTSSATNVPPEQLAKITDGHKESGETNIVLLGEGVQWVQIDLGSPREIYGIGIWRPQYPPRVCHGVVVQVADDADFAGNIRTLFNNDREGGDRLGGGTNREYLESNAGKLIEDKGVKARYVRLYSRGSTEGCMNDYTEVEV
jgi:hypothetical protein